MGYNCGRSSGRLNNIPITSYKNGNWKNTR
jgi:hypothetical protein